MIVSPSAIGCSANTPLPWMPERRTWMRRPRGGAVTVGWVLAGLFRGVAFFGYIEFMGARACTCARGARIVGMPISSSMTAPENDDETNEQSTDHCREAFGGAGHRPRAHARRGQVRQARRVLRERALHRHLGGRPPARDQGAGGVRRQARQVELRPPARDPAALRPGAARQDQDAPERDRPPGQAEGRERAHQRLRRRPRGRADLSPDPAAREVEAPGQAPLAAEHDAGGDPRRLRAPAQRQADCAAWPRRRAAAPRPTGWSASTARGR